MPWDLKAGLEAAGVCSKLGLNAGHVLEALFVRKEGLETFKLLLEDVNDVRTREEANEYWLAKPLERQYGPPQPWHSERLAPIYKIDHHGSTLVYRLTRQWSGWVTA